MASVNTDRNLVGQFADSVELTFFHILRNGNRGTMKATRASMILGGFLFAVACQSSTGSGPSRIFSIAVKGRVVTETGVPVAGAALEINSVDAASRVFPTGKCVGDARIPVTAVTGTDGRFTTVLTAGGIPVTLCITVNVTPPVGSGFAPASAVADSVVLSSPEVDTLSFELTLKKAQ